MPLWKERRFEGIVIGGSIGSINPLCSILSVLPENYSIPIAVAIHRSSGSAEFHKIFNTSNIALKIYEPNDRDEFVPGKVYLAPADYHMLIDKNKTICLSTADFNNYARPSIDELFETAADCFGKGLVAVILSGASKDGNQGLAKVKAKGGIVIAQNPLKAEQEYMIRSAMETNKIDYLYNEDQIGGLLKKLGETSSKPSV